MYKFHFQPSDGYLGDCMPFYWDGQYHIFYLKASLQNTGVENLIWSHIKSKDLLHWEELPDVLCPGSDENAPDKDGCWSGSVIHHQGKFYIFYTGVRGFGTEHFQQSICIAQSDDLIHFHKSRQNPILSMDTELYSVGWSDPFVFWNKNDGIFWMLITTQGRGKIRTRNGCIGLAKSADLKQWEVHKPFYYPNTILYPEVSELFTCNGRWYLLYCESADFCRGHYRVSENIRGPWRMPAKSDSFDASEFYAMKTVFDGHDRYGFGWIRRKQGDKDEGMPMWGGALGIARKITAAEDGSLKVYYPNSFKGCESQKTAIVPQSIYGKLETEGNNFRIGIAHGGALAMCMADQDHFYFRSKIAFSDAAPYFGVIFRAKEDFSNAYKIRFDRPSGNITAEYLGSDATMFKSPWGLAQRPLSFCDKNEFEFEMFVDLDIVEVFVDRELAMSFRAYERPGMGFAFFVDQGLVEFTDHEFYVI